jgi:hypothetical protein
MAQQFETVIELTGKVDPSVAKAIGLSVRELGKINAAYSTINKLQKQANLAANGLPPALQKTTVQIAKANRAAEQLGNSFKKAGEIAAGVFAGEAFLGALEKGLDIVKEIGNSIKEFGISSLEVRGKREVLQNQQRSMLESLGRGGQFGDLDMMLRNMEGRTTMIKYSQLMAATNRLESAAPNRFNSVESVHNMLNKLSDVSKDPATFDLATQAFTRILAAGKLDAKHIQELGFDTGYSFGPAIAKALNMSPEQMTDAMKKHKISGSQGIDALFKAFDIITGPGGAAYKHAEAQLKGWEGVVARWEGHMEDFKESFGKQLENFFSPIAEEIFKYLTPAALTHAFDGLEQFSRHMGEVASALFSGVFVPLETKLPIFFNGIKDPLQGFSHWIDSFFVEVNDPVNGLHSVFKSDGFNAVNSFVDGTTKMFTAIDKFVESSLVKDLASFSWSEITQDFTFMFAALEELAVAYEDLKSGQWWKIQGDMDKVKEKYWGSGGHGASGSWNNNSAPGDSLEMQQLLERQHAASGSAKNGSWERYTSFGPGVAGDQPGGGSYDWNSYHGIGAYGHLRNGDVAMHRAYARQHYNIGPGEYYTSDKDGKRHRYQDETGAKAFNNEDFYKGADIKVEQHFHISSDSGDHIIQIIKERSYEVARHVHAEIHEQMSRSAVV